MGTGPAPTFGDLLRRHRMAAGLTHAALAERAGLSVRAISDLERGVNRRPRKETWALLAEALGLSPQERAALEAAIQRQGAPAPPELSLLAALAPASALPPLVGRAPETALIERHLASMGPAVVLFLAGEPGIGKSRLLYEAAQRGASRGWTVLAGACHRRSGQEPYEPFLSALERYVSSQSPGRRRLDLRGCEWLVRLLPELAETALAPAPTWTLPPEQERRLMFGAVGRLLANVASPSGTLLLLDDLQWSGQDALDLLAALVRARPAAPLRVVGAYRDTEIGSHSPLGVLVTDLAREGRAARAGLGPLPAEEAAELFRTLLSEGEGDGEDAALQEQVLRRAGGVPYFLVSCAQSLRSGAVDRSAVGGALPWDVAESIRQRVAALPQVAQDLLATAAIAGRRVARPLLISLAARSSWEEEEVVVALDAMCHARLLVEEEEQAYTFAHDLVREVVGADLSAAHRAALHRRVAEALERGSGEPPVEALAYHYSRAGEIERATGYLEQAGDRARARHAYAQAEAYYRELVERLDGLGWAEQAASAREKLGFILRTMARYDEALAVLDRSAADRRAAGNMEGAVHAEAEIATVYGLRGTAKEGVARLQPLLESLSVLPLTPRGLAALYGGMARLLGEAGRYVEALAAAERSSEYARMAEDARLLGQAEHRRGRALAALGRLGEALPVVEQAIPLLEVSGELRSLCNAVCSVGMVYEATGEFERAVRYYERALQLGEPMNDPTLSGVLQADLAGCEFCLGGWDRARTGFERALATFGAVRTSINLSTPLLGLGALGMAEGQVEAASRYLQEAIAVAERSGDLAALRPAHSALAERDLLEGHPEAACTRLEPLLDRPPQQEADVTRYLLPLLAWATLELGEEAQAESLVQRCLARANAQQLRPALVDALRIQAMLAAHRGRWPEAEAATRQALALTHEMRYPYAEAKVLYTFGLLHAQQGEPEQARERLEAALAICGRLGERLYAERVERTLAELP